MAQRLATVRAAWNADRSKLVPDTSEEAVTLAYPVGSEVDPDDVEAYEDFLVELDVEPSEDTDDHGGEGGEPLLAQWRVWMDGQGNFVHERDPLAVSLKYAVNDPVDAEDVEAYRAMGEAPQAEPGRGVVIVKESAVPENKMVSPAASKRKPSKSRARSTAGTGDSVTDPAAGDGDGGTAETVTVPPAEK